MNVELLDMMGNDLTVVNSARVSFNKQSNFDLVCKCGQTEPTQGWPCTHGGCEFQEMLKAKDVKLINFLAREHHWLPFRHPHVQFHCKAPIFVARQAVKHQVGMSWSEVSRRYVTDDPEFYRPYPWRKRADNKKQGSSNETVESCWNSLFMESQNIEQVYEDFLGSCETTYANMLEAGVAPELARIVLPQAAYVEWIWTGSLLSWAHFVKQRTDEHAQKEIRDFAEAFVPHLEGLFPHSWTALMEHYSP